MEAPQNQIIEFIALQNELAALGLSSSRSTVNRASEHLGIVPFKKSGRLGFSRGDADRIIRALDWRPANAEV